VGVQIIVERDVVLARDEMKDTQMSPECKVIKMSVGDMATNHRPYLGAPGDLGEEGRNGEVLIHFCVTEDRGNTDETFSSGLYFAGSDKHSVGELNLGGNFLNDLKGLNLGVIDVGLRGMDIPQMLKF